jgi:hypothetical protein
MRPTTNAHGGAQLSPKFDAPFDPSGAEPDTSRFFAKDAIVETTNGTGQE